MPSVPLLLFKKIDQIILFERFEPFINHFKILCTYIKFILNFETHISPLVSEKIGKISKKLVLYYLTHIVIS